ncbi:LIM/homeobox protein Lhx1 [Hondaea fermentalgiana]|uniref:LIM/homeobox protein Lhx1 n=1 Tax=Hondaea fermentalgiana TaxID=2315210 RepID=A0A2R5GLV2_9STRA|nr:LIM/homeobox protein Lhx1 [Hondaea fermentalgiana]|eukprot:GBG30718.1 LIM/homeobox protein Lhx1 [Hondaea fermentalgiana]
MASLLRRLSGASQRRDGADGDDGDEPRDVAPDAEDGAAPSAGGGAGGAGGLRARIAAFEKAAREALDPAVMQAKISGQSDRKKYNFSAGLQNDVRATRAALRAVCEDGDGDSCCFGDLFRHIDGQIANLNRVLQNLKREREIDFAPEIFLEGTHDAERITLLDKFWDQEYEVDHGNVFRAGDVNFKDVAQDERLGRSYVRDNLATRDEHICTVCNEEVSALDRMTVRDKVFHLRCLHCAQCGSQPRDKSERVSFDGQFVCSAECMKNYDAAHLKQARN